MGDTDGVGSAQVTARLLSTLEQLLAMEATDLSVTLDQACHLVAEALGADKVDALFHDPASDSLVANGTSHTPMGHKQHAIGMNRMPLANGGREVAVYLGGQPYVTGHADQDPEQLRGITEGLGVRSAIIVPLEVASVHRGVFLASSAEPDYFREDDLPFLKAVSHWVGMVAYRAELVEQLAMDAREQGRRVAADDLISTLAHDLGNLLTPLKTRLDLVHRRAAREQRERDQRDVEAAVAAVNRLTTLMRDLLDSSRLDHGIFALDVQSTDLAELVRQTCAALATDPVPIYVEAPVSLVVSADEERLRQALENLLTNAVKYAPQGTSVTVEVSTEAPDEDGHAWAVITVSDQGPGVPPELRSRLFDRFARGPGSTGLGLGLYLASRVATAHGGMLTADPHPPVGARFSLRLPLSGWDARIGPIDDMEI